MFGVTAHAVAAVLATYLAGLALGAWWLGRAADRRRDPLRIYGLLELGVAVSALLTSWIAPLLQPLHGWAASRFAPDSAMLAVVRLLLASVLVLPPRRLLAPTRPAWPRPFAKRWGGRARGPT